MVEGSTSRPDMASPAVVQGLPKVGIVCSFSLAQVQEMISSGNPLFREFSGPEWRMVELPTGHWPMFSRPDDLAGLLLDLPSEKSLGNGVRAT